ncbi:sensor histidine kinase [Flammeovirga aprica]|uniref:histidine kinase n=1 Tax=Flammeovirga aprica JL-4 TaxID=694437 RepID=A0A7X9RY08_9BACT|nr:ATP-binding protein [Flammeovirga aprica]NME70760.1 GHKL domain-containing protein [Flammeovirga aprica JL-4]
MKKLISNLINMGTGIGYDFETEKKIRLTNLLSLVSSLFALFMFMDFMTSGLSIYVCLSVLSLFFILIFIPILHQKEFKLFPRLLYCVYSLVNVIILSVVMGPDVQSQYFLFAYLGLPMVIFGYEMGNLKVVLSLLGLVVFLYLEWHFVNFKPLIEVPEELVYSQRLINNIITILVVILLYYFLNRENKRYVDQVKDSIFKEEQSKSLEYFAYLSHDLKEPLRSVSGFTNIIKMEYHDEENKELNKYFGFIENGVEKMNTLIDSLSQLATSGKTSDLKKIDLNFVLEEVKIMLNEMIMDKQAIIQAKNLPIILCYTTDIKQIFSNLISNAIKYQKEGNRPVVKISCLEKKDDWEFCIEDNGIGITEGNQERIFKFFTRLHSDVEYEGSGLGLSFCKNLVDRHFGNMWVESEVGQGSKFYFTISKQLRKEGVTRAELGNYKNMEIRPNRSDAV